MTPRAPAHHNPPRRPGTAGNVPTESDMTCALIAILISLGLAPKTCNGGLMDNVACECNGGWM